MSRQRPQAQHGKKRPLTVGGAATDVASSLPETLEPVVRQLLASPEPTAIGYGPDLLALHNDAFSRSISTEANASSARRTLGELCSELWPRLAPLIDRALESGDSTVLEDQLLCRFRGGYAEEAYLHV